MKLRTAVAAFAAVGLACTCEAATAKDTASSLHVVDHASVGPLTANPRAHVVAYLDGDGRLAVRGEAGQVRRFDVPPDCGPAGVSRSAVVLNCPSGEDMSNQLLDVADGTMRDITPHVPGFGYTSAVALGSQWAGFGGLTPDLHAQHVSILENLRTGATITLNHDPFGARRSINLNTATGAAPICGGLRRHRQIDDSFDLDEWQPVEVIGGRFYEPERTYDAGTLTDCATRTRRAVRLTEPTLNRHYLAGFEVMSPSILVLRNLATNRVRHFTMKISSRYGNVESSAVLSADALWTLSSDGQVSELQLPS